MHRPLAALAVTFALTVSLAACGGDSGLTKEELISQGDAICQTGKDKVNAAVAKFTKVDPNANEVIEFIKLKLVPAYETELAELKALEPDSDAKDDWNQMITKVDQGVQKIKADPSVAISGETSPMAEASQAARDFGMKVCGTGD